MTPGKDKTLGTEHRSIVAKDLGKGQEETFGGDGKQDQLHNWQGPVQNENAGPLVKKLLSISRW